MRTTIKNQVAKMTVAQMRKEATKYGIKNPSKYRREQLQEMLVDAIVEVNKAKAKSADKRIKAEQVNNEEVENLAKEMLEGIETLSEDELMHTNRKVLIVMMKMLHCSKWYRTYDKATMVNKITQAVA